MVIRFPGDVGVLTLELNMRTLHLTGTTPSRGMTHVHFGRWSTKRDFWTMRIIVPLLVLVLAVVCWVLRPQPDMPIETDEIIGMIGYDEDGGCLNDPECSGKK